MRINHNIAALNTHRQLGANGAGASKNLERLSSGLRINRAGDDAAGLAISEKMRGQIRGLDQATRNAQDGISLIQTAEGALNETHSILQRMKELATQAANGTNTAEDRGEIQKEMNQLSSEINRIGNTTEFNTEKVLNGGSGATSQIRYSVENSGVAEGTATGAVSTTNQITASVKAGTGAVSTVTKVTDSVAEIPSSSPPAVTGAVTGVYTNTAGVKGGTGEVALFRIDQNSVQLGTGGAIGSPFLVTTASVTGGSGAITGVDELVIGGVGAVAHVETTASVAPVAGQNTYEITTNFAVADTITIGTVTFTAIAPGVPGAGQFAVGATADDTAANLRTAMETSTLGGTYTFTVNGDTITATETVATNATPNNLGNYTGLTGTGTVTHTETVASVVPVAGENTFQLTAQFGEGQTITIGGQTFTAVAAGAVAAEGQFNIGATLGDTATSLSAALTASDLNDDYAFTVGGVGGATITATERDTTDVATNLDTHSVGTGIQAKYAFEVLNNFTVGDTLDLGTFGSLTAVANGATPGVNQFEIGLSIEDTRDNIITALNLAGNFTAAGYTATASDSLINDGEPDNNLIVLTQDIAALDTNAAQIKLGEATPVGATLGEYQFEISDMFEDGQKINIGGVEFTAKLGAATASLREFSINTNVAGGPEINVQDIAASLMAAVNASDLTDATTGKYDVSLGTTNITNDTLIFTEKVASGVDMVAPVVSDQDEVVGKYSFELKTQFSVGDKIDIDGQVLTAVAAGSGNSANTFEVGADVEETAANLLDSIQSNTTLNTHYASSAVAGSNGNNLIKLEEKVGQADGSNLTAPAVALAAETLGNYDFTVTNNFTAGEKVTIGGQEFVAVSTTPTPGSNEFQVDDDDIEDTVASLITAINEKLDGQYTASRLGAQVILEEVGGTATGIAPTISAITSTGVGAEPGVQGEYNFSITSNFSAGDKIEIEGKTFTAKASGAIAEDGEFNATASMSATVDSLVAAINADATLGTAGRFTASKVTDNTDPLNPSYSVKLLENVGDESGDNTVTATVDKLDEVQGVYTVDVTTNFAVGDKLNIAGQTLTAGLTNTATTFQVGADSAATAANLKAAIDLNTTLNAKYSVTASNGSIALTEQATKATGVALTNAVVEGAATSGKYSFSMSDLKAGSVVTVDGIALTLATGGSGKETAEELQSLIAGNTGLNAKYSVSVDGPEVTLTQKAGQESASAPKLSYQTQAGSGFSANMQIGANTGQSMSISVSDMRSLALGVTSSDRSDQAVTVDGKEYVVAWTVNESVTNGSDDVGVEFALNVSDKDSATAAVEVLSRAINAVSSERSKLGAFQNRLEHTINNLGTSAENLTAAESRIRDVDMAKEMMEFTKNNILTQAAQSMLAQANQQPQGVLQLLR